MPANLTMVSSTDNVQPSAISSRKRTVAQFLSLKIRIGSQVVYHGEKAVITAINIGAFSMHHCAIYPVCLQSLRDGRHFKAQLNDIKAII